MPAPLTSAISASDMGAIADSAHSGEVASSHSIRLAGRNRRNSMTAPERRHDSRSFFIDMAVYFLCDPAVRTAAQGVSDGANVATFTSATRLTRRTAQYQKK